MASQTTAVLRALRAGETLTAMRAVEEFGCLRLAARIDDLRVLGHDIESKIKKLPNGKRIAFYSMKDEAPFA